MKLSDEFVNYRNHFNIKIFVKTQMEENITRFFFKNDLNKLCLMLPTICGGRRFEPFYEMQQMSLDLFNRQTLLGKYLN